MSYLPVLGFQQQIDDIYKIGYFEQDLLTKELFTKTLVYRTQKAPNALLREADVHNSFFLSSHNGTASLTED